MKTLAFFIVILQDTSWADLVDDAPEGDFSSYIDAFGKFIIAGAVILVLMTAGKIYNNWNLGSGPIYKSVANLFFGIVFLIGVYLFVRTTF